MDPNIYLVLLSGLLRKYSDCLAQQIQGGNDPWTHYYVKLGKYQPGNERTLASLR